MKRASTFRVRLLLVLVGVGVVGTLLTLLHERSPESSGFWPPCLMYVATGLHCPGCGTTRCLYSLLHGDILQALAYNIPFVVMLPFIVYWSGRWAYYYLRDETPPRYASWPRWVVFSLVGIIYLYGAVRNLPMEPFCYLAPHRLESTAPNE